MSAGWFGVGMSGVRRQQQAELIQGVHVIFSPAANVAAPSWKIGDRDQLVTQPGKIGNKQPVHLTRLAFGTWHGVV